MDSFAQSRTFSFSEQNRSGSTISINWPLWKDGGMSMDTALSCVAGVHAGNSTLGTGEALDIWISLCGITRNSGLY